MTPAWVEPAALIAFAAALILAEAVAPAHPKGLPRVQRWSVNAGLWLLSVAVAALLARVAPAAAAGWSAAAGVGVLHSLDWPWVLEAALAFLILDLAVYWQHRALHWPGLWRLHVAHHTDPELDVSTALRFHPAEIAASLVWKSAVCVAVGAPVWVAVAFEMALSAASLFAHANIALPAPIERVARLLVVTPAIHRLHHDRAASAAAPNYGTILSLWDRLFATWRVGPEPAALGLPDWAERGAALAPTLASPVRLTPAASSAPRRTPAAGDPAE